MLVLNLEDGVCAFVLLTRGGPVAVTNNGEAGVVSLGLFHLSITGKEKEIVEERAADIVVSLTFIFLFAVSRYRIASSLLCNNVWRNASPTWVCL